MKTSRQRGKTRNYNAEGYMDIIGRRCIVRTESAGVFFATVEKLDGGQAELANSRRIWYWKGAATLSELAVRGTKKPDQCKFPVAVSSQIARKVIEVIPVTDAAAESIDSVPEWTA